MKYVHRNGNKALWCLKDLAISYGCNEELINNLTADVEKELKALEIIKEKQINVNGLINHFKYGNGNYEIYLKMYRYLGLLLTQDEFDLLKEVLL